MSHPIRIGVISDTHIPGRAKAIPPRVFRDFEGVDYILHAGDVLEERVIDDLAALAPIEVVAGNNDPINIVHRYGWKKIVSIGPYKIGLTHGHIGKKATTPDRAQEMFASEEVEVIVFGHSHQPFMERRNGVLLFNPGSPTDRRRESQFSIGFLTLGKTIEGRWVKWS